MAALFYYSSLIEYNDSVGTLYSGEAVGNNKLRIPLNLAIHSRRFRPRVSRIWRQDTVSFPLSLFLVPAGNWGRGQMKHPKLRVTTKNSRRIAAVRKVSAYFLLTKIQSYYSELKSRKERWAIKYSRQVAFNLQCTVKNS